jgi:hypothetical protein
MAQPSTSRDLSADEIVHILEEPIDECMNISDSGSEIDSDEDESDGDKFSESSENEDSSESDQKNKEVRDLSVVKLTVSGSGRK